MIYEQMSEEDKKVADTIVRVVEEVGQVLYRTMDAVKYDRGFQYIVKDWRDLAMKIIEAAWEES